VDELAGYQRELNIRYEFFFSNLMQSKERQAA